MAIRILFASDQHNLLGAGITQPVFECDCCGLRIDDARDAVFSWNQAEDRDGRGAPVFFAHRGECFTALQSQVAQKGGTLASDDLEMLPGYLGRNMIPDHTAEFEVVRRDKR